MPASDRLPDLVSPRFASRAQVQGRPKATPHVEDELSDELAARVQVVTMAAKALRSEAKAMLARGGVTAPHSSETPSFAQQGDSAGYGPGKGVKELRLEESGRSLRTSACPRGIVAERVQAIESAFSRQVQHTKWCPGPRVAVEARKSSEVTPRKSLPSKADGAASTPRCCPDNSLQSQDNSRQQSKTHRGLTPPAPWTAGSWHPIGARSAQNAQQPQSRPPP